MRIYISAPFELQETLAAEMTSLLQLNGHEVVSSWISIKLQSIPAEAKEFALLDVKDLKSAEALLALNPPEWANRGTGGRHVEFGYALREGLKIFLYGARTNVFHHHPRVQFIPFGGSVIEALKNG